MRLHRIAVAFIFLSSLPAAGADIKSEQKSGPIGFIAGLAPYQRPAGSPAIREFANAEAWRARAMRGVVDPPPAGLGFLKSQGAWYTPFGEPGMPGYYDLRGFHRRASGTQPPR